MVDNKERFAKAKKAFEDNLNHLREKEKQVPAYVVNLSRELFELTQAIEAEILETRKALKGPIADAWEVSWPIHRETFRRFSESSASAKSRVLSMAIAKRGVANFLTYLCNHQRY